MRIRFLPTALILGALPLVACESAPGPEPVDAVSAADAAPAPAPRTFEPAVPGDPMGVIVHKLDNGLTVMLSENHTEPRFTAWVTARTGSAKDPADATGLAHYLEHMLFKGTTRLGTTDWEQEKPHLDAITELYDQLFGTQDEAARAAIFAKIDEHNRAASAYSVPNEFDKIYDQWGARGLNAFTSTDQTSYVVDLPSNRLASWADLENERFTNPVFRLFQTELEAVYEEKNRAMDNKARVVWEAMSEALYPEHPYGTQTTIGTVEHLKNPSLRKMYEYFHKWYVPGNMVIAIAGDIDPAQTIEILERTFGTWPVKPVPPDPQHPTPKPKGVKRVETRYEAEEYVQIAFLTVPASHPDRDALVLCDMLMDNQQTGFINVNLTQAQAVGTAGSGPQFLPQAGAQFLNGTPKAGQTLEEVEALLLEQVEKLKAGEFDDSALAAVITDFEINEKTALESNSSRVREMTGAFIDAVDWAHKVRELDRLRTVTKERVVAAANRYFGGDYVVVYRRKGIPEIPKIDKPPFGKVDLGQDRHSALFDEFTHVKVEPITPRFVEKGRDYEVHPTLAGDLYWVHNPLNDLFTLTFRFPVGTDHDPRLQMAFPLFGYAGAGDMDRTAFKRKLYSLGSTITGNSGEEETVVTVTGLDKNLEETLDLLKLQVDSPTDLSDGFLQMLLGRYLFMRQQQKLQVPAINAALGSYATRGSESQFLKSPTDAELKATKLDDLLAAVRDLWHVERKATYVGTRSPQEVIALITKSYAPDATFAKGHEKRPVVYENPGKNRVLFVDKEATQAQVGMFSADGGFSPEEVPFTKAYNEYMSGSMGAIVFQEVREARALAYSCWTSYRAAGDKDDQNLMTGSVGTQADKTVEALDVMMGLLRDMPVRDNRYSEVQRAIDEGYRTGWLNFRQVPGVVQTWEDQGYDTDPRRWNWERIGSMTLEELKAFANRFKDAHFTITVVGPKDRIDLEALGRFGEVIEMTPDQLFAW